MQGQNTHPLKYLVLALTFFAWSCNDTVLEEQHYNPAKPPFNTLQFPLLSRVYFSGRIYTDPITCFKVYDSAGKPLPNFTIKALKEPYTVLANISYSITNDRGFAKVLFGVCDSLELANLTILSGKKYRFSTRNLPDTITLKLTKSLAEFWPSTR